MNTIFFLTSAGEYDLLSEPRRCVEKARLHDSVRDDHMLVEIGPLLIGQPFGLGQEDIKQLILSTYYRGHTLFPIDQWPCHVYVTRLLDESVIDSLSFGKGQVELIARAALLPTMQEAQSYAKIL